MKFSTVFIASIVGLMTGVHAGPAVALVRTVLGGRDIYSRDLQSLFARDPEAATISEYEGQVLKGTLSPLMTAALASQGITPPGTRKGRSLARRSPVKTKLDKNVPLPKDVALDHVKSGQPIPAGILKNLIKMKWNVPANKMGGLKAAAPAKAGRSLSARDYDDLYARDMEDLYTRDFDDIYTRDFDDIYARDAEAEAYADADADAEADAYFQERDADFEL